MDSNLLKTEQIHVVLGPVASDDFPGAVVAPDGEGQAQHVVAGLVILRMPRTLSLLDLEVLHQLVLHDAGPVVEEALHHLEEVGVILIVSHHLTVVSPGRW